MSTPQTLSPAEEQILLARVKRAADLVAGGLAPDDAITKVARADRLGPGTIEVLCRAYNTGTQLGQWRANSSLLDKLAEFPLADPERVIAAVYPPTAETPKAAADRLADAAEYALPPDWLPDARALAAARRPTPLMQKAAASTCPTCGKAPCACAKCGQDTLTAVHARLSRAKLARDEARRQAAELDDRLRGGVAGVVAYFKQAAHDRLSYAQAEHGARAYLGPAAVDLLKIAHARARLREPGADRVPIEKAAIDLAARPFDLLGGCIKLAGALLDARKALSAAEAAVAKEAAALRPFARGGRPPGPTPPGRPTSSPPADGEKRGMLGLAIGTALGNAATRTLGNYPKEKSDLIEDDWLALEDPGHQNELRKIHTHAMLNSMLTDPDDPISGYDPDKVLGAYNEIAQGFPRAADNPAVLKPLLRKRLAGHVEPFEAQELVNIEKGLRDTRNVPPSNLALGQAPPSLLG